MNEENRKLIWKTIQETGDMGPIDLWAMTQKVEMPMHMWL